MIYVFGLATNRFNSYDYRMAQKKYRYIYRDARTGRLVTAAYAAANPSTTVRETVEV